MSSGVPEPIRLVWDVVPVPERWYLEDGVIMPDSVDHDARIDLLRRVLKGASERAPRNVSVVAHVALRWDQKHPRVGVDPDLMLVEPAIPEGAKSVLTWKPGMNPPRVAVEIVSESNPDKDYFDGPAKYAASGTRELWVFDPEGYGPDGSGGPYVIQVWRRDVRGRFRRVYAGDGPAFSRELRVWLVVTDAGKNLRLADDAKGNDLWPTLEEEAEARAAMERKGREEAEARASAERQGREQAEARASAEGEKREQAEARARAEHEGREAAEAKARTERQGREQAETKARTLEAEIERLKAGAKKTGRRAKKG